MPKPQKGPGSVPVPLSPDKGSPTACTSPGNQSPCAAGDGGCGSTLPGCVYPAKQATSQSADGLTLQGGFTISTGATSLACPPKSPARWPVYSLGGGYSALDRATALENLAQRYSAPFDALFKGPACCGSTLGPGGQVVSSNGNLMLQTGVPAGDGFAPRPLLTHNSTETQDSEFGFGWMGLYSQRITKIGASLDVDIDKATGRTWQYTYAGNYVFTPPADAVNALVTTTYGWRETQPDGFELHYYSYNDGSKDRGRLGRLKNSSGSLWTLTHYDPTSAQPRVKYIQDPLNRRTTFAYDGSDKIQQIVDVAGRTTNFKVDGSSDLVRVITPELCITSIAYDAHRVKTWIAPGGQRTTYSYQKLADNEDRLHEIQLPSGALTTYTFKTTTRGRVINPRNYITTFTVDAQNTGRLAQLIDPFLRGPRSPGRTACWRGSSTPATPATPIPIRRWPTAPGGWTRSPCRPAGGSATTTRRAPPIGSPR